jgi:hypothetical protein
MAMPAHAPRYRLAPVKRDAHALAGHQLITLALAAAPSTCTFHSGIPDLPNKSGAAEVLAILPLANPSTYEAIG